MKTLFGAIDIGASSGRVIAGVFEGGKLTLNEVHRFSNGPKQVGDRLVWDFDALITQVRLGLRELGARAEKLGLDVTSVGIDTWAVDYGGFLRRFGQRWQLGFPAELLSRSPK